ncbi:MAG TPA: hypothetical protein VFW48_08045, partial [Solirubrobacterales bacterium]|nr:hypothetical protein [Solirubrobacterales bacterium]
MRRLTILLATVAAFLLVPVAQAAAEGTMTVTLAGTGSGKVVSEGISGGTPLLNCSGPPATGICENAMVEEEAEEFYFVIVGPAIPDPGSEFTGWTVEEGINFGCGGETCSVIVPFGADAKVKATFQDEPGENPLTVIKEGT